MTPDFRLVIDYSMCAPEYGGKGEQVFVNVRRIAMIKLFDVEGKYREINFGGNQIVVVDAQTAEALLT